MPYIPKYRQHRHALGVVESGGDGDLRAEGGHLDHAVVAAVGDEDVACHVHGHAGGGLEPAADGDLGAVGLDLDDPVVAGVGDESAAVVVHHGAGHVEPASGREVKEQIAGVQFRSFTW